MLLFQLMWGRCCPGDGSVHLPAGHRAVVPAELGMGLEKSLHLHPGTAGAVLLPEHPGSTFAWASGGWAEGVRLAAGWCLLSHSESGSNSSLISSSVHLSTLLGGLGCAAFPVGSPFTEGLWHCSPQTQLIRASELQNFPMLNSSSFLPLTDVLYLF